MGLKNPVSCLHHIIDQYAKVAFVKEKPLIFVKKVLSEKYDIISEYMSSFPIRDTLAAAHACTTAQIVLKSSLKRKLSSRKEM